MSNIIITDDGIELRDGTVVILSRFPSKKFIVHNGWYSYQGSQYFGWYLSSIPEQHTYPLNESDLVDIKVVSSCSNPHNHEFNRCDGIPYTPKDKYQLDRSFITVNTIEQLSKLNETIVPDGRIVKVNDTGDGSTSYFTYDQPNQRWVPENFGIDTSKYVTDDDVGSIVDSNIKNYDMSEKIASSIDEDESVRKSIESIAKDSIKWKIINE